MPITLSHVGSPAGSMAHRQTSRFLHPRCCSKLCGPSSLMLLTHNRALGKMPGIVDKDCLRVDQAHAWDFHDSMPSLCPARPPPRFALTRCLRQISLSTRTAPLGLLALVEGGTGTIRRSHCCVPELVWQGTLPSLTTPQNLTMACEMCGSGIVGWVVQIDSCAWFKFTHSLETDSHKTVPVLWDGGNHSNISILTELNHHNRMTLEYLLGLVYA